MKILQTILALFIFLFPALSFAEQITDFEVDITIADDGTLLVKEVIDYDFSGEEKHGIYRFLPNQNNPIDAERPWYLKPQISSDVLNVWQDGEPATFTVENDGLFGVYIGDEDTVVTGAHTYEIHYEVIGALEKNDDQHLLRWNVVGDAWAVPIDEVVVRLTPAEGVLLAQSGSCFIETMAEVISCVYSAHSNNMADFRHFGLNAGEGFVIQQFVTLPGEMKVNEGFKTSLVIGSIVLTLVLLFILLLLFYRRSTSGITTQYKPYQEFAPLFTGVLYDGALHNNDILAGLITLAQEGFVSITEIVQQTSSGTNTDYRLTLLQSPAQATADHAQLLQFFFPELIVGTSVTIGELYELSKQNKYQRHLGVLKRTIFDQLLGEGFFHKKVFGIFLIRSRKGRAARSYLLGFQKYLSKQDDAAKSGVRYQADRFMLYFPYAVALGTEEQWANLFKEVKIKTPEWFRSQETVFDVQSFVKKITLISKMLFQE